MLSGRPQPPVDAREAFELVVGHARGGDVRCVLYVARCFGSHRAPAAASAPVTALHDDAAFAEVDSLAERRRTLDADDDWMDPESRRHQSWPGRQSPARTSCESA